MIVKGARAFSGAKQLLQLLGSAWQWGGMGLPWGFPAISDWEGLAGAGGGCFPPLHLSSCVALGSKLFPGILIPNGLDVAGWDVLVPLVVWPGGLGVHLSSFTRCLGVPPNSFTGDSGVPPSPVHVFRDHGAHKEPECTSSPLHDVRQELFGLPPVNQRLSSGDDPLFPCRICVSQLPPGFPIALCSLPLWQGTFSSAQQCLCCWEDCLPKERWTPVGKHLGAISSTCYLESGSWNRVGRNKADSVLSLINDCWDRGAGAGLARRYRSVTSGQECTARLQGFVVQG